MWSPRADKDLFAAWVYIAEDSPVSADAVEGRLVYSAERLTEYPLLGRRGRVFGTREFPVGHTSFTLIYRVRSAKVSIRPRTSSETKVPLSSSGAGTESAEGCAETGGISERSRTRHCDFDRLGPLRQSTWPAKRLPRCRQRELELGLAMRGRHESRLEGGGREIDAALEHGVKETIEARHVALHHLCEACRR